MQIVSGDLWDYLGKRPLVIPVNIGWKVDGRAVMGAGLALQAVRRWPKIAIAWGFICQEKGETTPVSRWDSPDGPILLFPVKPLVYPAWLSWQQPASLYLIAGSLRQLVDGWSSWPGAAVPLVGCGNGRLEEDQVMPLLEEYLGHLDDALIVRDLI